MSEKRKDPMKVITGKNTRWSYANVWEPKSINGGKPKYSVSLIIPKSDTRTIEKIKAAIKAAREAYDALTDKEKEDVDTEALAKLQAAEQALADAEKAAFEDEKDIFPDTVCAA